MDSILEIIDNICRILVGANFLFFGLNGFFFWIKQPEAEEKMEKFISALNETNFMMPLIKGTETFAGVLLLINFKLTLAIAILSPIVVTITLSHLLLNGKKGYGITAFTAIPYVILIILNGHRFVFFLS